MTAQTLPDDPNYCFVPAYRGQIRIVRHDRLYPERWLRAQTP